MKESNFTRGKDYETTISKGVTLIAQSDYDNGLRLDTTVEIRGKFVVAGSELPDFENALRDLIDRWRI